MIIENKNNVTIDEQVIGSFKEATESVKLGTNYWNPVCFAAGGDMFNMLPRQGKFDEVTNGWDTIKGDSTQESELILGDVVTPVYYLTGQDVGVIIKNVHGGTVNVDARYYGKGLQVVNCSGLQIKVTSKMCGMGLALSDCTDIEISHGNYQYTADAHIRTLRCRNITISNNDLSHGCLCESTGGIYNIELSDSVIENNRISYNAFGNYWKYDGGGIYLEHHSTGNIVRKNTVYSSHLALQDNAGSDTNLFERNILIDDKYAFDSTDSLNIGNVKAVYKNNILINTNDSGPRTNSNGNQILVAA